MSSSCEEWVDHVLVICKHIYHTSIRFTYYSYFFFSFDFAWFKSGFNKDNPSIKSVSWSGGGGGGGGGPYNLR